MAESLKAGKSGALGFLKVKVSVGSSGVKEKLGRLTMRQA